MKIINLLLICSIFFCNNLLSAEIEEIAISCEGNFHRDYSTSKPDETAPFHQDLQISVANGKIFWVKILDSSIWFQMKTNYGKHKKKGDAKIMGNLILSDDQKIIKLEAPEIINNDKESGSIVKSSFRSIINSRLSLINGTLSGSFRYEQYGDGKELLRTTYYTYKANCAGINTILASINKSNTLPNELDIDDNEIIPASSGTGFLISKEGLLITNNHVIEGCSAIKAIYKGEEFNSKVVAVDRRNDLAIIDTGIASNYAYSISDVDGQLLEDVIVAGYPLGKKVSSSIKATSGTITALAGLDDNYSEFQTDAALNSGNSGGPIINEFGNVIGVAVSKLIKEGVDSFNFGIKVSTLKTFARSNGIEFLDPNNKIMKRKDLGKLITEATIYLDCWMTGKEIKKLIANNQNSQKAFYSEILN
ncbi:serine protease [Candidatus Pelagibacter sp.]|nr:serine protease [Candidatus Pelagibacter sp.]